MAISSVFADFCISDEETAENFLHALELSEEKASQAPIVPSSATTTDPAEICALLRKRKERNGITKRDDQSH